MSLKPQTLKTVVLKSMAKSALLLMDMAVEITFTGKEPTVDSEALETFKKLAQSIVTMCEALQK